MMLRILADENLPASVVERLREAGLDVASIREGSRGELDGNIAKRSAEEGRILLTYDKDFGELLFANPPQIELAHGEWGVILLRLEKMPYQERSHRIVEVLTTGHIKFSGCFSVIEAERVRQRDLPRPDPSSPNQS